MSISLTKGELIVCLQSFFCFFSRSQNNLYAKRHILGWHILVFHTSHDLLAPVNTSDFCRPGQHPDCNFRKESCYELNFIPRKRHVEVPIPSTCKCDFICKQGLCRSNQVSVISLRWALIQHNVCPYRKGKSEHRVRCRQREDDLDTYQKSAM